MKVTERIHALLDAGELLLPDFTDSQIVIKKSGNANLEVYVKGEGNNELFDPVTGPDLTTCLKQLAENIRARLLAARSSIKKSVAGDKLPGVRPGDKP